MSSSSADRLTAQLRRILDTPSRRAAISSRVHFGTLGERVLTQCHPKQRAFVEDSSRWIAARCGSRAGKTTGGRARFVRTLTSIPRARCLYIATTRTEAENLMWAPLKQLSDDLGLGAEFAEQKLTMTVPGTGGTLRLVGADDKKQIEKYRGQPWHEVQIDEVASHSTRILNWLIERIIGPRLGDYHGTLVLYGTPGHILAGDFYDITRPGSERGIPYDRRHDPDFEGVEGWSTHAWNAKDGADAGVPAMINAWQHFLDTKRRNGWSDDHPVHRREHMGEWAADNTEGVFRYRPHLDDGTPWNQWDPEKDEHGFATLPKGEWFYTYGMDMGHSDPFALQIGAHQPQSRELLHVYEFSRKKMTIRAIAELLVGPEWVKRVLNSQDPGPARGLIGHTGWPYGMVADTAGLGGAMLQELGEVYGIPVEKAEKKDKHDAIELCNGDLLDPLDHADHSRGARTKILKGSELEQQMARLQWAVDDNGMLKEDRGQRNDCADAWVYLRRKAMHLVGAEGEAPPPTRTEAVDQWLKTTIKKAEGADEWPEDRAREEFGDFDNDWG